jgi:hypothetical protein
VVTKNKFVWLIIYILKHRAQHLLLRNIALPQIRKPSHNRRLSPIVIRLWVGLSEVRVIAAARDIRISCLKRADRLWGPSSLILNWFRGYFPGKVVKQPKSDIDHWSPSRAVVKNKWNNTSTPPVGLLGVNRYNFIFYTSFSAVTDWALVPVACCTSELQSDFLNVLYIYLGFSDRRLDL